MVRQLLSQQKVLMLPSQQARKQKLVPKEKSRQLLREKKQKEKETKQRERKNLQQRRM